MDQPVEAGPFEAKTLNETQNNMFSKFGLSSQPRKAKCQGNLQY